MPSNSTLDPATIQAYRETEYQVHGGANLTLEVDIPCPELAALHGTHRVDCSAFVTACNPFSRPLDEVSNARRQAALARELEQRRLTFLGGVGQHPSNGWPGEPSFLVLGLPLDAATDLGLRLEQNAVIWSGADAIPRLILLR